MEQTIDTLIFEQAVPADLPEVLALFQAATKRMDEQGIPQWDDVYPNREVLGCDIARGELTVGRIEGKIACVFVLSEQYNEEYAQGRWLYPGSRFCILHRLCVHPDFQHRRIAARAMDYIETALRKEGVASVRLDAFSLNPYALRLYESRGYEKAGEVTFRKGLFYLYEKKI
ncbi:MAG TPA: GNAT family N-acetyltransferase [Candidatus Cryosericum sp.]|nr:GNAT family N-acetyltransferase [Candidatus Cryosericum sp.]